MTIKPVTTKDIAAVQRFIAASPEDIFAIISDPARHPEFDGSGTVKQARSKGRKLALGDSFGMSMHWFVPYSTRNVVVDYEEARCIAWKTLAAEPLARVITGRVWRYDLEPVDGGTLVTETWDIREEALLSRPFVRRLHAQTTKNMARSLERLEELTTL